MYQWIHNVLADILNHALASRRIEKGIVSKDTYATNKRIASSFEGIENTQREKKMN